MATVTATTAPATRKTGRFAILEQFLADGMRYMFGNPGTVEQGFLDALTEYPDLRYILTLQESVAVMVADGYARATQKPTLVQLHSTPGVGNAIGNLQEYWDEIYSNPRLLGGFIWEWADQGLRKSAPDGTKFIAYGGDFGDRPNLGAFCIKGIVTSDRELYPKYWEVKKVYQPVAIEPVNLRPGKVVVRVSGARARDVLAKGCPVDLHARAFGPGAAAATEIAHMGCLVWQVDDRPTFDLAVNRSLSKSFWSWLAASAAEYGYEVA